MSTHYHCGRVYARRLYQHSRAQDEPMILGFLQLYYKIKLIFLSTALIEKEGAARTVSAKVHHRWGLSGDPRRFWC